MNTSSQCGAGRNFDHIQRIIVVALAGCRRSGGRACLLSSSLTFGYKLCSVRQEKTTDMPPLGRPDGCCWPISCAWRGRSALPSPPAAAMGLWEAVAALSAASWRCTRPGGEISSLHLNLHVLATLSLCRCIVIYHGARASFGIKSVEREACTVCTRMWRTYCVSNFCTAFDSRTTFESAISDSMLAWQVVAFTAAMVWAPWQAAAAHKVVLLMEAAAADGSCERDAPVAP